MFLKLCKPLYKMNAYSIAGGEKMRCPNKKCGKPNLFVDKERGEIICRHCGTVVDESMVVFSPEWKFSEEGERTGRVGAPLSERIPDKGIRTKIGQYSDLSKLPTKQKYRMKRLQMWQNRTVTAIERNLIYAFKEINNICSFLKLSDKIIEECSSIYRTAVERGLVRGRSMESIAAGIIYAVCRIHEFPRTLDEISEASQISKKDLGRTYRFVARELHLRVSPSDPVDYVGRFGGALKLSPKTETMSVEIIEKIKKAELNSGRGPMGLAAAALYVAALINGEKRTQREVADIAGVTEVTIRNRYKEIIEKLDLKIKKKI